MQLLVYPSYFLFHVKFVHKIYYIIEYALITIRKTAEPFHAKSSTLRIYLPLTVVYNEGIKTGRS